MAVEPALDEEADMGGLKDMWGLDDPNVGAAGDC